MYRAETGSKQARPSAHFRDWCSANDWVRRAQAYDDHCAAEGLKAVESLRLLQFIEAAKAHLEGTQIQRSRLDDLTPEQLNAFMRVVGDEMKHHDARKAPQAPQERIVVRNYGNIGDDDDRG